jgi:hypothetical protein
MRHLLFFLFGLLFTAVVFSQNVDTSTNYQFVNGTWQPASRNVTTYDASCRASNTLYQVWQTSSSSWANNQLTTYAYNASNQVIQQTVENWNTSTNSWDNSEQYISTYNSNDLPDSVLFQVWRTGAWQDSTLTINSYNTDNLEDTSTIQTWTGTSWINPRSSYFFYNADNTIEAMEGWGYEIEYTYNSLKQLLYRDSVIAFRIGFPCLPEHVVWHSAGHETFAYNDLNALVNVTTYYTHWERTGQPPFFCVGNFYSSLVYQTNYTYNGDGTLAEIIGIEGLSDTTYKTTYHYSTSCLLPLTLLSFTAALDGKAAQLHWTTATEINTKNFIVQRSIDAVHFQNIGSVNAVGNSTKITSYSFDDAGAFNAGANKLYYRLQMVDKDGKFTYSNIATVHIADGKLFVIYPNPVKDELLITGNASLNNAQIRICDPGGRVVYQQILNGQTGTATINVSGFSNGVYYLQLITGSDAQTTKFVKY